MNILKPRNGPLYERKPRGNIKINVNSVKNPAKRWI
jgi:hypothetical protein